MREIFASNLLTVDYLWLLLVSCILKVTFANTFLLKAGKKKRTQQLDFSEAPISPCAWPMGCGPIIAVPLGDRQIFYQVWQVRVGRVNLYLLDTNISDNREEDRGLSARLYTANQEERLRQLIVLGIGGVRALRELHIKPVVWHANEDHTAFMMLERLREERAKGTSLKEAIEKVRKSTVFTTHTPVAAGQHIFPYHLMDRYARNFWESLGY